MSSLLLSLLLLIYPSPSPLRSPPSPSLVFRCLRGWLCCESKAVLWGGGGGVQGSAEAYNLLFTPNLPPQLSLSPAFSPFFIPPFVCTVGWILITRLSTSDLGSPPRFSFFFPLFSPSRTTRFPTFSNLYPAPFSPYRSLADQALSKSPEKTRTQI